MRTRSRLDAVFKNAFPVPFDDTSKLVFFSDTHRGDNSISDEFGPNRHIYYHALSYYYQKDFTYVEVGDGDELWEHPNYDLIRSAHITVFEMLKKFYRSNRMLLLFGNHNMFLRDEKYCKKHLYKYYDDAAGEWMDLFPGIIAHEALILTHRDTEQKIFVVHGHQGDLLNDQLWKVSFFLIRYFWRFMHLIGVQYAASPAKNKEKRHKVEKNFNKWNSQHGIMLICGHTHRPRFPKVSEPAYFNTGCCMHPRGITCLEIMCGEVALVSWNIHTRRDGTLYVKRTVINGPEHISRYQSESKEEDFNE